MSSFIPDNRLPRRAVSSLDIRQTSVRRVDADLPALDPQRFTANGLRKRFKAPPIWRPEVEGWRAQLQMAQAGVAGAEAPVLAAVFIGIVQRKGAPTVLLTQRTSTLGAHAGQIAFPGGHIEQGEAPVDAALREMWEETGIDAAHAEVLGILPALLTGTGFDVTPVVGLLCPGFVARAAPAEVEEIFEVPLAFLMNPAHHQYHQATVQGVRCEWIAIPYQDGEKERFIWGATAALLRNLYRFLAA